MGDYHFQHRYYFLSSVYTLLIELGFVVILVQASMRPEPAAAFVVLLNQLFGPFFSNPSCPQIACPEVVCPECPACPDVVCATLPPIPACPEVVEAVCRRDSFAATNSTSTCWELPVYTEKVAWVAGAGAVGALAGSVLTRWNFAEVIAVGPVQLGHGVLVE